MSGLLPRRDLLRLRAGLLAEPGHHEQRNARDPKRDLKAGEEKDERAVSVVAHSVHDLVCCGGRSPEPQREDDDWAAGQNDDDQ